MLLARDISKTSHRKWLEAHEDLYLADNRKRMCSMGLQIIAYHTDSNSCVLQSLKCQRDTMMLHQTRDMLDTLHKEFLISMSFMGRDVVEGSCRGVPKS